MLSLHISEEGRSGNETGQDLEICMACKIRGRAGLTWSEQGGFGLVDMWLREASGIGQDKSPSLVIIDEIGWPLIFLHLM